MPDRPDRVRSALRAIAWLGVCVTLGWGVPAVAQPSQINQGQAEGVEGEALLKGANVLVDVWGLSGLETSPGAYLSQLYVVLMPSYDLGGRHFKGTWAQRIRLTGRLFVYGEFTGNSLALRGPDYVAPAITQQDIGAAGGQPTTGGELPGLSDRGGFSRRIDTSDIWLAAFHDKLWTVPGIDADLQAGVRLVVPASVWSRNMGLVVAPSTYAGLARSWSDVDLGAFKLGSIDLSLGSRLTRYFFASSTVRGVGLDEPVELNGQLVTPWRPDSRGDTLPGWLLATTFSGGFSLPADLYFSLAYTHFAQWNDGPTQCSVPGVPTADVCRDGALVGPVNPEYRTDFGYFLADLTWSAWSWGSVGVGLGTWAPVWRNDRELGNPFWRVDRNNWTTVYASFSLNAEALAKALKK